MKNEFGNQSDTEYDENKKYNFSLYQNKKITHIYKIVYGCTVCNNFHCEKIF